MPLKQEDIRIVDACVFNVNGKKSKRFAAYVKNGDAFIFFQYFSVPMRTPNWRLWEVVAQIHLEENQE